MCLLLTFLQFCFPNILESPKQTLCSTEVCVCFVVLNYWTDEFFNPINVKTRLNHEHLGFFYDFISRNSESMVSIELRIINSTNTIKKKAKEK